MPKQINKLSAVAVAAAKTPGMYADGNGLYLQLSVAGAKSWVFRFRFGGKRRDMGLGAAATVSLAAARVSAGEYRRLLTQGVDPIRAREMERRASGSRQTTFRQAFETFFQLKRKSLLNAKHLNQWSATMSTYVFPHIGDQPVADVQTEEILAVLTPIWFDKPETARRVLQRLEAVFRSAILRGHRERASPCIGVVQELGTRHRMVTSHRSLPYSEVPGFIAALRSSNCLPATRLAFEWLVLTASRSGETRMAAWNEIDNRKGLWVVPSHRSKTRREHVVPLPPRCIAILRHARSLTSSCDLIFPGSRTGRPLSDMTFTKVLRDFGIDNRATTHGFRSSFKNWAAEVPRARDEVSEACLAHQVRDKVRAAYLRTDFLAERKTVMRQWAEHCLSDCYSKITPQAIGHCELGATTAGTSRL